MGEMLCRAGWLADCTAQARLWGLEQFLGSRPLQERNDEHRGCDTQDLGPQAAGWTV